jgi:poly(3-hydroxybutyrate) depolymerase
MTLMGGPIDTRVNPTAPNDLAQSQSLQWFERNVITTVPVSYPGFLRRVYPGFLQLTGFMTMNLERHMTAHRRLYEHLVKGDGDSVAAHQKFYDEYLSVMDLPAEYYLQTIKTVFQDHALPEGTFHWRDRKVDPGAITDIGLLTVEGELDDISGIGQTRAAHDLCRNLPDAKKHHHHQAATGHYGIFNGRRWRNEILPRVHEAVLANA